MLLIRTVGCRVPTEGKEVDMTVKRSVVLFLTITGVLLFPGAAQAQELSISIVERHVALTADGSFTFTVRVSCELPGTEDFREGLAGATQPKTGAAAEGGLGPDVICDGVERIYTAGISLITEQEFKRGPAVARATVIACNTVGDEQVCVQGSAVRRVIVSGHPA
jgi:hypothetical protein